MEINETEMQTYIAECEILFDDTVAEIYRIADEHKAMEKELVKAFIENLKEEFKID